MNCRAGLRRLLFALCAVPAAGLALDTLRGERVVLHPEEAYDRPLLLWALDADLAGTARDDLFVLGPQVRFSGRAANDLWVIADRAQVGGEVADHARIAGNQVIVEGAVRNGLWALGGTVKVAPGAVIGGDTTIRARDVILEGTLDGPVHIVAGSVTLAGTVRGNLRITADTLVALPHARIEGDLAYTAPNEFLPDPRVTVAGRLARIPAPESSPALPYFLFAGALLTGVSFLLLFPRFAGAGARAARESFGACLLQGALAAALLPLAVAVGLATVVGIPLALVLATAGGALLYLAQFPVALAVGSWLLRRRGPQPAGVALAALAAGLLALYLLASIPVAGPFVVPAAVVTGFGALLRALRFRDPGPPPIPPDAALIRPAVVPPPLPPPRNPGDPR